MSDNEKRLKDTLLALEKQMGEGIFFTNKKDAKIDRWALSSPALNYVFGGGFPKGRIAELYGRESHGKTLIATIIAADIQKQGGKILYIDAEHGFDFEFAKVFGLDGENENFILAHPDCAEDAMDITEQIAKTGSIDLIIIDSIAALSPKAEMEGSNSDQQMGALARVLSKAFRKMVATLGKTGTSLICINQIREKIGGYSPYGPVITTPGGNALKFYASIRAEIKKVEDIKGVKGDDDLVGLVTKVKIKKNKTSLSGREADIAISFTEGMDFTSQYVDFGITKNVALVEKTGGAWYQIEGQRMNGKAKMIDFFKDPANKHLLDKLKKQVEACFVGKQGEFLEEPEKVEKRKKKEVLDTVGIDSVE